MLGKLRKEKEKVMYSLNNLKSVVPILVDKVCGYLLHLFFQQFIFYCIF